MANRLEDSVIRHDTALINGVNTKISCAIPNGVDNERVCIVVIPGNPGSIEFYDIFIEALFKECEKRIPIYGVGHAGHCQLDESGYFSCGRPKTFEHEEYDGAMHLEDQISHKLSFIAYHLPRECKVILIGHSVGAYIALQMMKRYHEKDKFLKGILLFPAIEHVMESPSGRLWWVACFYLQWPFLFMTFFFSLMPTILKKWSIGWWMHFNRHSCHESTVNATNTFLNYHAMENMLKIGQDLGTIKDIDIPSVAENMEKLTFYYGAHDPWVPRSCYEQMTKRFPNADIMICDDEIQHAFVLNAAETEKLATKVGQWLNKEFTVV